MLPSFDIVLFSDYAKGALARVTQLIEIAREHGKMTLVDPKLTDPRAYKGASVLKPNALEFSRLFGEQQDVAGIVKCSLQALEEHDLQHIIVTRGAQGAVTISRDGMVHEVPTRAREVFDVSGAGDTMISALAIALGRGEDIVAATNFANFAASIAVAKIGTYVVTASDLARAEIENRLTGKVCELPDLERLLEQERLHGRRIVFTNGCFDILHAGHVRYLEAARAQGDILVLGLNSDQSVKGLKGPQRPVNTFRDRAEVLAGLSCVSYVVEFDAPTPLALIETVRPDVLVKGGDYNITEIVGYDFVTSHGGKVVTVDFHQGYSSTRIIEKISRPS